MANVEIDSEFEDNESQISEESQVDDDLHDVNMGLFYFVGDILGELYPPNRFMYWIKDSAEYDSDSIPKLGNEKNVMKLNPDTLGRFMEKWGCFYVSESYRNVYSAKIMVHEDILLVVYPIDGADLSQVLNFFSEDYFKKFVPKTTQ